MGLATETNISKKIFTSDLKALESSIDTLLVDSERAITELAGHFERLAQTIQQILECSTSIVDCIECDSMREMFTKVSSLGEASKQFIEVRLSATQGVLEMASTEQTLLDRLIQLARAQRSIARETQTLSVLTNIEVARLGDLGLGFKYLAHELDDFSSAVADGLKELIQQTEERKRSLDVTKKQLASSLPQLQRSAELNLEDLTHVLSEVDQSQHALAQVPARLRMIAEEISMEIAGIVAAVQSYDITRQQLEHVRTGVQLIEELKNNLNEEEDLAPIAAGLAIQVYQLDSIRFTMNSWCEQIGGCISKILQISNSEVAELGKNVASNEQELASRLERVESLESECNRDHGSVQKTFASLAQLTELVGEHVQHSSKVRERLRLLTFNSIVEASHLGEKADAILEISQSIKRVSEDWSRMTTDASTVKEEILGLMDESSSGMSVFSDESTDGLRMAQNETRAGMTDLRSRVACTEENLRAMDAAIGDLHGRVGSVSNARDQLVSSMSRIDATRSELEGTMKALERELHQNLLQTLSSCNPVAIEEKYGFCYTTELEREVLRAALQQAPLPEHQTEVVGNDVELF